ncbi:MAG: hypothetical protein ACOCSR_02180 [Wenzhouxiangella sp.]
MDSRIHPVPEDELSAAYRSLLIPLLVAAVMLRAMVVDGYMPDEDGAIKLCTPDGMRTVVLDPASGEPVETEEEGSAECPWASIFLSPAVFVTVALLPVFATASGSPESLPLIRGSHGPPGLPPVRGPPLVLS